MKKIMACIDFTAGTDRIVEKGIKLAAATDSGLCLIHVAPPKPDIPGNVYGKRSFPELARRLCKCNRHFDDFARRIKEAGIELTTIRARGEAAKTIADEATKNAAEMIIMGTKNNSALRHLIAGSVVADVMKKTQAAVVLVPVN
jgi:nucleotide-binding universal stress UspA family protein